MTIRALIVDDEELARERVRSLLAEHAHITIVGECSSGSQAVTAIQDLAPDLLFLDVQMPGLDGFDVLHEVGTDAVRAVIFVTAHDQFAIRAFDSLALDYLLKPFTSERFSQAVARATSWLSRADSAAIHRRLDQVLGELDRGVRRLMIREQGRITFVRAEEIDWLEAQGNYVRIHAGSRVHTLRDSLKDLAARLDPGRFLRVHRSTIVNLDRVREMTPLFHGEYLIVLNDGTELTSGRAFRSTLDRVMKRDVT